MKAVQCPICGLLVDPSRDYENMRQSVVGNHVDVVEESGFARLSEQVACPGSEMLGRVITLQRQTI